jgi:hypothetical protein
MWRRRKRDDQEACHPALEIFNDSSPYTLALMSRRDHYVHNSRIKPTIISGPTEANEFCTFKGKSLESAAGKRIANLSRIPFTPTDSNRFETCSQETAVSSRSIRILLCPLTVELSRPGGRRPEGRLQSDLSDALKRQPATASTHPYQVCTCHMAHREVCCPSSWASPMRIPSGPRM